MRALSRGLIEQARPLQAERGYCRRRGTPLLEAKKRFCACSCACSCTCWTSEMARALVRGWGALECSTRIDAAALGKCFGRRRRVRGGKVFVNGLTGTQIHTCV